ncbi:hypothetical protein K461DRAFT_295500 [Myriangium duriaei CBS 260.36]|uniref:Transcription factor domain-containing protein n=1 Tax=Myriangium duriaei CBS 260.36 TaxID=1168546 RepID=A0A9P4IZP2_9PEZI|nr:hypothetical protein K461DRAFT_295500 [Myriangium duriaei CBS 260.36]
MTESAAPLDDASSWNTSSSDSSTIWPWPLTDDPLLPGAIFQDFVASIDSESQSVGAERRSISHSVSSDNSNSPFPLFAFHDQDTNQFTWSINYPVHSCTTLTKVTHWCFWSQSGVSLALTDRGPMADLGLCSPAHLRNFGPIANHNADIIIQSLRAIPTMMQRRETFPWFIHKCSHMGGPNEEASFEPLVTCMSIAHMFVLRTAETRPALWAAITTEIRGLCDKRFDLSMHESLAAVQVCMVYSIMCIIDQSAEGQKASSDLLTSFTNIYLAFKKKYIQPENISGVVKHSQTWEDWIFDESQRRLQHLWFLIGCAICVKAGVVCDPHETCRDLMLPGPRALWETSTQPSWEAELELSRPLQASGLVTLGDLIDAQTSSHLLFSGQKLDKWNSGIDTLGSLLNLVGPMLS